MSVALRRPAVAKEPELRAKSLGLGSHVSVTHRPASAPSGRVISLWAVRLRRTEEGAALALALDARGVTQSALARWCGVSPATVSDWCLGAATIPPAKIALMRSVGIEWMSKLGGGL